MYIKHEKERKALDHYNKNVKYFDINKYLNAAMSVDTFNNIIKYFNIDLNNKNILDFGAGSGETSIHILNNYNINNITAIDYSKNRIKKLQKYITKFNNLQCIIMDVNYFIEENIHYNKYDIIFAFEIIEHLENPKYIISKLRKFLKVGGKIIGTIPLQNKPNNIHLSAFKSIDEVEKMLSVKVTDRFTLRFKNQLVFHC
jgi:2-polyprenyl-3-methyl-5-hydroxy-6-metoxy-1,4-benzoquinol methylase